MGLKDLQGNKWLKGMDQNTITFGSQQELTEAMQAKEYATDPDYRDVVTRMIANGEAAKAQQQGPLTGRELSRAMSDPAGARKMEDGLIAREQYQKMFTKRDEENGGLLYENSPTYRRQVEDWLKENSAAIDAQVGGAIIDRNQPQHRQAMRVTIGANVSEFENIKQGVRDQDAAKAKADLAAKHAALDAGQPTEHHDLGGRTV